MKKLAAITVALVLVLSCASASSIPPEEKFTYLFNACAGTFGAPEIDKENYQVSGGTVLFPCSGYDVIIDLDENGNYKTGGVRLLDESAGSNFLLACMAMISALGKIDITAFGTMMLQYGMFRSGDETKMPGILGLDYYAFIPGDGNPIVTFVYKNSDLEASI